MPDTIMKHHVRGKRGCIFDHPQTRPHRDSYYIDGRLKSPVRVQGEKQLAPIRSLSLQATYDSSSFVTLEIATVAYVYAPSVS